MEPLFKTYITTIVKILNDVFSSPIVNLCNEKTLYQFLISDCVVDYQN